MNVVSVILAGLLLASGMTGSGIATTSGNEAPLVDAGLDQTAVAGDTVWLDGGGSVDTDGSIVTYEWSITRDGETIAPANATAAKTQFTATDPGRYVVTLTATDDAGASSSDTLYVTVETAVPPTARITGPDTTTVATPTEFVAHASDPDGTVRSVRWGSGQRGEETVRNFTEAGAHTLTVTATDDDGRATTATKTVRVRPQNRRPTGRIRGSTALTRHDTATYTVDAADPDGNVTRIEWDDGTRGQTTDRRFSTTGTVRLSATLTDDDGATATLSTPVRVSPRDRGSSGGTAPTLSVDGPRIVPSGATVTYSATAADPDGGDVRRIEWTGLGRDASGPTRTHTFDAPAGAQREFSVRAVDTDGESTTRSVPVWITGAPTVGIDGIPEACLLAGSTRTLTANASDPDGVVTSYTWLVDGTVVGHTSSLTHAFTRNGTTEVTLRVTDDRGETASTTRTVCANARLKNSAPRIDSMTGYWYQEAAPTGTDQTKVPAFGRVVESQWPVMHYEAMATDSDGDALTFYWEYGDGNYGVQRPSDTSESQARHRSDISYSYEEQNSEARLNTYDVTLTVEDEHGAATSVDKTLRVRSHPTGNPRMYSLEIDSKTVGVNEPVAFQVQTNDPNQVDENRTDALLRYGDGNVERVSTTPGSGTVQVSKEFDDPGRYEVQLSPVFSQQQWRSTAVADTATVTVHAESYTEYHYTVRETESRVAPTSPGARWTRSGVDHTTRELETTERETVQSGSDRALDLERRGYQASDSFETLVRAGTRYQRGTESPGIGWTLDERNVDTVQRQNGWMYRSSSNRLYDQKWSLIRTTREATAIHQQNTGISQPSGEGWTPTAIVGQKHVDWRYGLADDISDVPNDAEITSSSVDRWGHEHGHDHDTSTKCVAWYYATCIDEEVVGHDHDTWIHTHTDRDYSYREPVTRSVWRWERTVTNYEKVFQYRKPRYADVPRHRYSKPVYEYRTMVEYEKPVYQYTNHYLWNRETTREEVSSTYPTGDDVQSVEVHRHDCDDLDSGRSSDCTTAPPGT